MALFVSTVEPVYGVDFLLSGPQKCGHPCTEAIETVLHHYQVKPVLVVPRMTITVNSL